MILFGHDAPLEIGDRDGHEHRTAERVDERFDRETERRDAGHDEGGEDDDGDGSELGHVDAPFLLPRRDPACWQVPRSRDARAGQNTTAPATAAIPTTAHGGRNRSSRNSSTTASGVAPVVHRGAEHGIPQRRGEQADDGGTDPGDGRLDLGALARRRPERQRRPEQQERRQEDRDERDRRARDAVRRRILDRAEVGREREQRPGHGLGGAVAGEECLLRDPPRDDDGLVEERQDDVAAAEDERAGAVEAVEQAQAVRRDGVSASHSGDEEQQHEGAARTRSPFAGRSGTGASAAAAAPGRGTA